MSQEDERRKNNWNAYSEDTGENEETSSARLASKKVHSVNETNETPDQLLMERKKATPPGGRGSVREVISDALIVP